MRGHPLMVRALDQMSPGRGPGLAWEKCAWTVFQPPDSLTITMVDRETKDGRSAS
jgi:hypothetical protein